MRELAKFGAKIHTFNINMYIQHEHQSQNTSLKLKNATESASCCSLGLYPAWLRARCPVGGGLNEDK